MKVFYSLPALIDHADTRLADVDVVSFDIFDTVFIRRMHDPDMVKFPVARFIAQEAADAGVTTTWREVWDLRNDVESGHRARHGKRHPDHEARYDEYMWETLEAIFGSSMSTELMEKVADYEMKMESAVIVPRADLVEWIRRLHELGKRVFLISDIYLPSKYLKRLVREKGLEPYVTEVISSADSFNAKASGAAFPLLSSRYGIDYRRWLHVGDHPISDGIRPAQAGIESLVIRDLKERQRKGIARLIDYYSTIRHFWKGRNIHNLMLPLEAENVERPPLYVHGYNLFGPILGYFIHALAEHCRERDIRRVFFCSREGWMFHECWKRMVPYLFPNGGAPDASYLYVSRIGLGNAACANVGLTPLNAAVALLPAQNQDFLDICRVFRLDIEPLRPFLRRAGIRDDEPLPALPPGEPLPAESNFARLLKDPDFQEEVRRQGTGSREAANRYLESQGFFEHDRIALVDIGWLGTIQHYLNDAIAHRPNRPSLHGFLLAASRMAPYPNNPDNRADGLVFDQFRFNLAGSFILTIKDVLEEVCRAPHPTVTGYDFEGDQAVPTLRASDDEIGRAEGEQSDHYAPLHEGVFDAAARYAAAVTLMGYPARLVRPWLNFYLVTRLAFPKTREIDAVRHFAHQDEFAGKRTVADKILRRYRSLWELPMWILRFTPMLRVRYYLIHISRMLKLWS